MGLGRGDARGLLGDAGLRAGEASLSASVLAAAALDAFSLVSSSAWATVPTATSDADLSRSCCAVFWFASDWAICAESCLTSRCAEASADCAAASSALPACSAASLELSMMGTDGSSAFERGLGLGEAGLRLGHGHVEVDGVDLGERLALVHELVVGDEDRL